ncbi:MAG TPA: response regulator, partial [Nitrospirae bacterium]|nr:response regulator [Nitrospirota bacterium]
FGALNIYAAEPDAFDTEEVKLLTELSDDLVFGIKSLRARIKHKQTREEKEEIHAQLLHAQKMEAVGTLTAGIAHDFNNLLTAIIGYSEILLNRLEERNPLRKDIEQIKKAGERAASLTRQLLAFSRRQVLQTKVLNLNALVEGMDNMLRHLIGEDVDLITVLGPGLACVKADPGQIEHVIMNLAINARDAMPEGRKLTIMTENVTLNKVHCSTIPEARPGDFVCLSVADSGVGMDKEILQHIFEPFFSTKEAGKGTGLGLSVVYGIVKQHGGWVNVYSEPGQGSIFKVYLPAFFATADDKTEETVPLQGLRGNGERILLVEDETEVLEFAVRVLAENNYSVFKAANAKEAMDIFEREKGDFHVVFSDVVLPDKNGLQLVNQLLSHKPGLRVLLSSGYADRKTQWPLIRKMGFRFLQKPYALSDLLLAVREVLGQAG